MMLEGFPMSPKSRLVCSALASHTAADAHMTLHLVSTVKSKTKLVSVHEAGIRSCWGKHLGSTVWSPSWSPAPFCCPLNPENLAHALLDTETGYEFVIGWESMSDVLPFGIESMPSATLDHLHSKSPLISSNRMSSHKGASSKDLKDADLASLVSSIKKNVGGSAASSKPSSSVSSSSSGKKSSTTSKHSHTSSSEKKEGSKKHKELTEKDNKRAVAEKKKTPVLDDAELSPPKHRKRSRENMLHNAKEGEDKWDDEFEKDDIDDIFGKLKSTKEARAGAQKQEQADQEALQKLLERASQRSGNNSVALRSQNANRDPNRKYTEDGLPIYTTAELGLSNKGGDTNLCPFDCDCCF